MEKSSGQESTTIYCQLYVASTGNKTCPLDVVQEPSEVNNGLLLTFPPVNPKNCVIRESTDQNIKFSAASVCAQFTAWELEFDESIGRFFITTGGVEWNPGHETIGDWFKIRKYESDYKLGYCPAVCDLCRPLCGDIGILVQDGKRRLVTTLRDEFPLRIMFKKA